MPGYEVQEEVGRGGMGVIYKARHLRLGRIVALKMILTGQHASAHDLARFRTEAEAVARLRHPHIVQVYDVGEAAGRPFLSLEFVAGGSLKQRLTGRPFPAADSARFIETVARAVEHAHRAGIIHRDLKPGNILLQDEPAAASLAGGDRTETTTPGAVHPVSTGTLTTWVGSPAAPVQRRAGALPSPRITDFGLAKVLDSASAPGQLTGTGDMLGTPSYMAPEQAGSAAEVGPPADVYALGSILYELLAGRATFAAESALDTMLQLLHQEPVPVDRLQPGVPRDLATITMKCLEKPPAKRYPTAGALADDLARFLDGKAIEARPVGRSERAWRWCRRNPLVAGLAALVVLVFALGFAGTLGQMHQAQASAAEAAERHKAETLQGVAELREQEANTQRTLTERAAALSRLDQGLSQCAGGDVSLGLLLLADSLERAHRAGAVEMENALRCNLAAWSRQLPRITESGRHGTPVTAVAFPPDGQAVVAATWGNKDGQPGPAEIQFWQANPWERLGKPLPTPCPSGGWPSARTARAWRARAGTGRSVSGTWPGERCASRCSIRPRSTRSPSVPTARRC